jgi:hypothetical protein
MGEVQRYGIMFDGLPKLMDLVVMDSESDFASWRVVCSDPRKVRYDDDANEAIDETNFAAILNALGLKIADIGHADDETEREAAEVGAVMWEGYIGQNYGRTHLLLIAPSGEVQCLAMERIESAMELVSQLSEHPMLDEDEYCQRESDAWEAGMRDYLGDEVRDAQNRLALYAEHADMSEESSDAAYTMLDNIVSDEVAGILSRTLDYSYGFSGDYGPTFLEVVVKLLNGESDEWYRGHKTRLLATLAEHDVNAEGLLEVLGVIGAKSPGYGKLNVWEVSAEG